MHAAALRCSLLRRRVAQGFNGPVPHSSAFRMAATSVAVGTATPPPSASSGGAPTDDINDWSSLAAILTGDTNGMGGSGSVGFDSHTQQFDQGSHLTPDAIFSSASARAGSSDSAYHDPAADLGAALSPDGTPLTAGVAGGANVIEAEHPGLLQACEALLEDLAEARTPVLQAFARSRGAKATGKVGLLKELVEIAGRSDSISTAGRTSASRRVLGTETASMPSVRAAWSNESLEASMLENAARRVMSFEGRQTVQASIRQYSATTRSFSQRLLRALQDDFGPIAKAAVGGIHRDFVQEAERIIDAGDKKALASVFAALATYYIASSERGSLVTFSEASAQAVTEGIVQPAFESPAAPLATLERLMRMHGVVAREAALRDVDFAASPQAWGTDTAASFRRYVAETKARPLAATAATGAANAVALQAVPSWIVELVRQFESWEALTRSDVDSLRRAPAEVFDLIFVHVVAVVATERLLGQDVENVDSYVPAYYRSALRDAIASFRGDAGPDAPIRHLNLHVLGATEAGVGNSRGGRAAGSGDGIGTAGTSAGSGKGTAAAAAAARPVLRQRLFKGIHQQMMVAVRDDLSSPPLERVHLALAEAARVVHRAERSAATHRLLVQLTEALRFHMRFSKVFHLLSPADRDRVKQDGGRRSLLNLIDQLERERSTTPPTHEAVALIAVIMLYFCLRAPSSAATAVPLLTLYDSCVPDAIALSTLTFSDRRGRTASSIKMAHPPQLSYTSWLSSNTEGGSSLYKLLPAKAVKGSMSTVMLAARSPIIQALDAVSRVPWRINRFMLHVQEAILQEGYAFGKIRPAFYPLQFARMRTGEITKASPYHGAPEGSINANRKLMSRGLNFNYSEEQKRNWRDLQDTRSSRVHYIQALRQARALVNSARVYFPNNMDFRGRMYPMPGRLNHTGSDPFRAILEHADPKPLGQHGLWWLKVHVANKMGQSKLSYAERVRWVDDHVEDVVRSAEAPLSGDRWWQDGDEPMQALMACKELADALKHSTGPENFESRLPVAVDGSYNGLQHYSAIGRDEFGAKLVNLEPSERPADAYTGILKEMLKSITADAAADNSVAQRCIGSGQGLDRNHIKRKTIKRPIMTQVYGVTDYGMGEQIREELVNQNRAHALWSDAEMTEMSQYLRDKVNESLGVTFRQTQVCRMWLAEVTTLVARCQPRELMNAFMWTTPLGLIVRQPYNVNTDVGLFLPLGFTKVNGATTDPASRKQLTALAPNLIHSLDATHMAMTALAMQQEGCSMMAVHDSFWAHACDMPQLTRILREQFVELYTGFDPLREVKEQWEEMFFMDLRRHGVRLPDPPARGNFDLKRILDSEYFFS